MSKGVIVYVCSYCDAQYPKWVGRCSQCGKFGTVATEGMVLQRPAKISISTSSTQTINLGDFKNLRVSKFSSGSTEIDRVLGGGIVAGSVSLVTGEPGVGKSTLFLAMAGHLLQKTLYVSGEESAEQVSLRLQRLGISGENISFTTANEVSGLSQVILNKKPVLVVVDSLQTMFSNTSEGVPGSSTQVRAVLSGLIEAAKQGQSAIFVIGHVTKEGVAAGPKSIEHLVDVVLQLEGSPNQGLRFLRAVKNRFGPTDEVGVFQMGQYGLVEVKNPSEIFLSERHQGAGSCVTAVLEGSRSLLIELQALVTHSRLAYPKRATTGFDVNRLGVLLAVLGERAGVKLNYSDVYINLAGGFRSREPALDLAVVAAVASAALKKPLPSDLVVFGEVGLGGEVRPVLAAEKRINEAQRLGFKQVLLPNLPADSQIVSGIELVMIRTVAEAVDWLKC